MSIGQFGLLKTRRFLPLFFTQLLGAFNDNVFKNALVILITYRLAQQAHFNEQVMVTLAAGIFILPFFLFSATAGQLADKYERSRLIFFVKLAEVVLMLLAVIGFYWQSVSLLMLVLFLVGTQATFFGPLKYAILPDHLREDELVAGNGLIEASTFLAILCGTILGGLLILSTRGELLIALAILSVALLGVVSSWFIPKTKIANPALRINYNFLQETQRIVHHAAKQWDVFLTILGISWFWLVGAVFLAELSVFAKDVLSANEQVVTFFFTIFSVGIAIGSLLCNRLLKGKVHATYVPLGALGMTVFILDLYRASKDIAIATGSQLLNLGQFLLQLPNWHITLDLLAIAICGGIYIVPLYAILQQRSPATHRARTIACNNIMNALFMVLAAVGTMLLLSLQFTVMQVFLVVGIINALVALYICKLLPTFLIKSFLQGLIKLFYRAKVNGLQHYYAAGDRVVIIANHTSFLDAALLAALLPDKLTFAVNTFTAKQWWIRLFLSLVDAYPLDPTNPIALKSLINYVEQNKKCVIFPEGRITVTGALMKIYEGPGLVADKAKAKLLPVCIRGAQYTPFSRLKGKVRIRWFPTVTLTIFPAREINLPAEIKGRERRQKMAHYLYDLMAEVTFASSPYHQTLFNALLDARMTHGHNHIILEDVERHPVTYQQLIARSFILGRFLARSTTKGEYVGVLLPNSIGTAIIFFALHAFSRVPVLLNFSTGSKNVVSACRTAQFNSVYTSHRFVELAKLNGMIEQIKQNGVNVYYLEDLRQTIGKTDKLIGLCAAWLPRFYYKRVNAHSKKHPTLNSDTPAVVLFTSGSEGTPKGVVLSQTNIQANRFQLSACVDFTANDKILNALPLFHSFGLMAGLLLPIFSGIKIFLYPTPLHYRIIPELAYDINATILFGTDTFLAGYAKVAHPYNFYSLRYAFAGAEKLQEQTHKIWSQKFGVRILEGYGTTETSPVLATNTPMHNKPGTVGRLLPAIHYQLKPVAGIVDAGVLVVSGPNIMQGYLRAENPGVIETPKEGWYETGDVVSVDKLGYITIQGRLKRFAKIAGEMISLNMVESFVVALWPEYQHAVVAIADVKKGEQLILVTTYKQATREVLIEYAKQQGIAEIAIPKKIFPVEKMPLLGSGKIDYISVKQQVAPQEI